MQLPAAELRPELVEGLVEANGNDAIIKLHQHHPRAVIKPSRPSAPEVAPVASILFTACLIAPASSALSALIK